MGRDPVGVEFMKTLITSIFLIALGTSPVLAHTPMQNAVMDATETAISQVDPLGDGGEGMGNASAGDAAATGDATDPNQPGGKARKPQLCGGMDMMFILVFFGIFWFFIIRPQSKKQKDHQTFVSGLKKGEMVVSQGGIIGRISDFDDSTGAVILEVDKNTKIRIVRGHISGPVTTPGKDEEKEAKDKK